MPRADVAARDAEVVRDAVRSTIARGRYSASQVKTFRECRRKWAWDKIDGIERPSNEFAELGTRVHARLEEWLRSGKHPGDDLEGKIAMSGIQHLPSPGTCVVEHEGRVHTDVADYALRVDYAQVRDAEAAIHQKWLGVAYDPARGSFATHFVNPNARGRVSLPVVGDHKTTGSLDYAKRPVDLLHDEQVGLYGTQALRDFYGDSTDPEDVVAFEWVYYQTKGARRSRPVRVVFSREQIEANLAGVDETAREMDLAREHASTAKDLPPTPTHCSAYGGCGYKNLCGLTAAERLRGYMAQESWIEKMKRTQAAAAAAPAVEVAEVVEAEGEAEEAPAPVAARPRVVKPVAAAPKTVAKINKPAAVTKLPAKVATVPKAVAKVNPPEAPAAKAVVRPVVVNNSVAKSPTATTDVAVGLRDAAAIEFMSASIMRGENADDELARAKVAYSRADALLKARG